MRWVWTCNPGVRIAVMTLVFLCKTTSSLLVIDEQTKFCSRIAIQSAVKCTFRSTNQTVELRDVLDGRIRDVTVETARVLQGSIPCGVHLQIGSSRNVTLQDKGINSTATDDTPKDEPHRYRSKDRRSREAHFINDNRPIFFPDGGPVTSPPPPPDSPEKCVRNITATQSNFHSLQGKYNQASFKVSNFEELNGSFDRLRVQDSTLKQLSATVKEAFIMGTEIDTISGLEVNNYLYIDDAKIGLLEPQGLILRDFNTTEVDHSGGHIIQDMKVGKVKAGGLKFSSSVSVNDTEIKEADSRAIVIEAGGTVSLNNFHINVSSADCIVLQGEARLVLDNFHLRNLNIFISHMEVTSKTPHQTIYPLKALPDMDSTSSRNEVRILDSDEETDDDDNNIWSFKDSKYGFVGLSWFWVLIMAVVGIIAGIIMGVACKESITTKVDPKIGALSITLSDLIARDRANEMDNDDIRHNGHQRPPRNRCRDSGLTSSSFASYTDFRENGPNSPCHSPNPCQGRPKETPQNDIKEHNFYVHMSAVNRACDDAIYEDIDELKTGKSASQYMTMK